MTSAEMHLKSLGNELKFVTEPFRQHTSVAFGVHDGSPKGIGRRSDELLDLCE